MKNMDKTYSREDILFEKDIKDFLENVESYVRGMAEKQLGD